MSTQTYIPDAFVQHIKNYLPEDMSLDSFLEYCQKPLRKSIRVNTLKISVSDFIEKMQQQDWIFTAIPWCEQGFWLERPELQELHLPLGNTAEHLSGLFYIQEASSMLPPIALLNDVMDKDLMVLDVAAAPGSKTTQIAALMNNQGLIVANEFSSSRLRYLAANIQRCGVSNTATSHFDGCIFGGWTPETFDAILLDAPCSGEGTIRKDPDALKNWSLESINDIADTQSRLLSSAFAALKSGGTMVYSTCTLNPLENQQAILALLQQFPEALEIIPLNDLFVGAEQSVSAEGFLHVWPQIFDSEGFFVAKLRKRCSVETKYVGSIRKNFPYAPPSKKDLAELSNYLLEQFGYSLNNEQQVYQRNEQYWLFPVLSKPLLDKIRFERIGIKLAEQHRKGFRLAHDAFIVLGSEFTKHRIELDQQQLIQYYQGRDIPWPLTENMGEVGVYFQQQPVGLVKALKGKLKNALPRELVRDNRLISWE
ncbi:16S rRNA (cytosine(1407)-C(5))-methyltransferase RsmF [Alteromonadaceae bacterium BrNp21-10]|nr:16S rRNA (cytosine(1407)-C(5))-methyltransferase RsmF [Alteromonadaceae bacterium BrNp21-10]